MRNGFYEIWEEGSDANPSFHVTVAGMQIGPRVRTKQHVAVLIYKHTGGNWQTSPIVDRTRFAPNVDELLASLHQLHQAA